jgi:Mce-associated membrane protein
MDEDEGTTPRRPRRRAVRAAGPVAGASAPAERTTPIEPSPSPSPSPSGERESQPSGEPESQSSGEPESQPSLEPESQSRPESETQPESESQEPQPTEDVPARRRGVLLTAAFVVVVLSLVAAGSYLFVGLRASNADDARAERFVQTARQTVLNLTTIHPDSAQADVDRLLEGASGDFKAEFEGREGPFVEVVQQAKVDSNGEIIEAGIESSADDYAEVLVAARAMVQNSDAEEPQPRDFRLRVRVVDEGGVMTASRVEFVP